MTAREERKAVWMQQGKQSHLHCKPVMGKCVIVFVSTLKPGKRGSSSHAIFTPLTPKIFYKFSRDPGLQTGPASPELTCWCHLTQQVTLKFLPALGWEELYWGSKHCATRVHQTDTQLAGELALQFHWVKNDVWKCFWRRKMILASLFNFFHPFTFCHFSRPDVPKCHLEKSDSLALLTCQLLWLSEEAGHMASRLCTCNQPHNSMGICWFRGFIIFKHWFQAFRLQYYPDSQAEVNSRKLLTNFSA